MSAPIIIVGGGIVGLATARELLLRNPGADVLLFEKEAHLATHQTGHNSGVIHSGVYYAPGSAKALGCREGVALMNEFCDRHDIPRRAVGKVIVATLPGELPGLEKLHRQGVANGLSDLRMLDRDALREVEPAVTGLAALHIPGVAIVDYTRVCEKLRKEIDEAGGIIRTHSHVYKVICYPSEIIAVTDTDEYRGTFLINCGGLQCDRVARASGIEPPVRLIPFRGEYYTLRKEVADTVRGLVYPVPDPRYPFLGVHLTPTLTGDVTAGPNAVLALAREGYRWTDISLRDIREMTMYSGFWRMAAQHWRTGVYEVSRSLSRKSYADCVRRFLSDLSVDDLGPGGSGVRAQAVDASGQLIHDFLHVRQERAVHILNAPSPAATASLSIAKRIVDLIEPGSI